jgi:hypothetical protein
MDIKLNFINQSNDRNNTSVAIFAKNVAPAFDELAVAWIVIKNCGVGDNHPFVYPLGVTIGASDSFGNYTPQFAAQPGQMFEMVLDASGDVLRLSAQPASAPTAYEVLNALQMGAIGAHVYKDGKLYARKTNIAPQQKAAFQFKPTIFIGAVSQVEEGEVMNEAVVSSINTEISLMGIASADIVMTGGGPGPNSTPFEFTLQNVIMA